MRARAEPGRPHAAAGGGPWLEEIAAASADVVGVDWTVDLGRARRRVGSGVALQGNLDPAVLFAGADAIRSEVARVLASFGPADGGTGRNGHVFNLGHGISQHTPPESVAALTAAVAELRAAGTDVDDPDENDTYRYAHFIAPDGDLYELVQELAPPTS